MSLFSKIAKSLAGKSADKQEASGQVVSESLDQGQNQPKQNTSPESKVPKTSSRRQRPNKRGTKNQSDQRQPAKGVSDDARSKKRRSTRPNMEQQPAAKRPRGALTEFLKLGLSDKLLDAIWDQGYHSPSPIQSATILDITKGRDILGCAQTGTGKTAAFALPILERLSCSHHPKPVLRNLVLTPTRELAIQVAQSFQDYGRYLDLRVGVVFGGVNAEPQKKMLRQGLDILVATPGRLLDLQQQGCIQFDRLEILVLDEADRMLDMGFLPDIKRILGLIPKRRQNLLFSATMPKDIRELAARILQDPREVKVAPVSSTAEKVEQSVYFVNRINKRDLLLHLLSDLDATKILIFTRTKAIANRITKFLEKNAISAEPIHGNKSQSARQRALENFRSGKTRVLVATDLAARGLDVDQITHVINYDLPNIPETYVHRIGRTGRADASGIALSFCDGEERAYLRDIERLSDIRIEVIQDHPFPYDEALETKTAEASAVQRHRPRGGSSLRRPPSRTPSSSKTAKASSKQRRRRKSDF